MFRSTDTRGDSKEKRRVHPRIDTLPINPWLLKVWSITYSVHGHPHADPAITVLLLIGNHYTGRGPRGKTVKTVTDRPLLAFVPARDASSVR